MLSARLHAATVVGVLCASVAFGSLHAQHRASAPARPAAASAAPAASPTIRHAHRPPARVASRSHQRHEHHRHHLTQARKVRRVLRVARHLRGHPYVWGAAGPHAFDCSGYVQFVFKRALGQHIPKYTDTQYAKLQHIHRRTLRPGDLVFVGWPHHHKWDVGIYAGHGKWWDAPHTGSHVKKQRIWGSVHSYARVIRR
jgi:cell wall-associated NlpC family hydrolase